MIFFKSLEEVISSGEVAEGGIVLRVLNEGSAEIGKTIRELVTEVEGTQTRSIFGGAISLEVIVQLVSEMKTKYSGTLWRSKG